MRKVNIADVKRRFMEMKDLKKTEIQSERDDNPEAQVPNPAGKNEYVRKDLANEN